MWCLSNAIQCELLFIAHAWVADSNRIHTDTPARGLREAVNSFRLEYCSDVASVRVYAKKEVIHRKCGCELHWVAGAGHKLRRNSAQHHMAGHNLA